ncbi:AraC family ligand binding domain-containing protein [Streptomyces sp. NPDC060031]|uniref:AraC family ligand binding domain-containing protein n=1 Tax=Streptomyces sp. NPDC060031 TaxID=3347043 RepID=UPI00367597E6
MSTPDPAAPVFVAPPHSAPLGDGRIGVVWALADRARDLDANLVHLAPGAEIGEHTENVLGVLLVVVAGTGELRTPDAAWALTPGSLAWLPAGTTRSVRAGAEGLTYTTAHRRRPPLTISPALQADGGEPPCLLNRVCAECGRLATDSDARYCARCGTGLAG